MLSHSGFNLYFPHAGDVEHLPIYLLAIFMSSSENACSGPLPIFKLVYLIFTIEL